MASNEAKTNPAIVFSKKPFVEGTHRLVIRTIARSSLVRHGFTGKMPFVRWKG